MGGGEWAPRGRREAGGAGHHDERDCPFRLANTGAIGFLSAATAVPLPDVARRLRDRRGDFSRHSSRNYAANAASTLAR